MSDELVMGSQASSSGRFRRYVCGKRNETEAIRNNKTQTGTDQNMTDFHDKWAADVFAQAFAKIESDPKIPVKSQSESEKFLAFYLSCYHSLAPNTRASKSLKRFLTSIGLVWPTKLSYTSGTDLLELVSKFEFEYNAGAFFRVGLSHRHRDMYDVIIKPPAENRFVFAPYRRETYLKYVRAVLKLMSSESTSEINRLSDKILSIEEKLYNLVANGSQTNVRDRIPFKDISKSFSSMNDQRWKNTFERFYAVVERTINQTILVQNLEYINEFINLMNSTDGVLYVGWRLIRLVGCLTNEIRQLENSLNLDIDFCSKTIVSPKEYCRGFSAKLLLPQLMSFAAEHLVQKREIDGVQQIVLKIQSALVDGLRENKLIDIGTRQTAVKKIETMTILMPEMKIKYKNQSTIPDLTSDFISNWFNVVPQMDFPARSVDIEHALHQLYAHHVSYNSTTNTLKIALAATKLPYYSAGLPSSIAYARLGRMIAHEMFHALDLSGREYDDAERNISWWSAQFSEIHKNQSNCFAGQYDSKAMDPTTLIEDMMDNGAIRYAFDAFQNAREADVAGQMIDIPNVQSNASHINTSSEATSNQKKSFTADQTFFIAYCQQFCEQSGDPAESHEGDAASYRRGEDRCNIPVMNLEVFSTAFGCAKKNDTELCRLW